MRKDVRTIVRVAIRQGWKVKSLGTGHLMLYAPDGITKVVSPGTPSDYRSLKNAIAMMRRAGFR